MDELARSGRASRLRAMSIAVSHRLMSLQAIRFRYEGGSTPDARLEFTFRLATGRLASRLVGILHGCLKTRTLYDEATAWSHRQNLSQSSVAA